MNSVFSRNARCGVAGWLAVAAAMVGIGPASAATIGEAVTAVGSSTEVGVGIQDVRPLLDPVNPSIGYYIPLRPATSGTFGSTGSGNTCGASGIGTCVDWGINSTGTLRMILRFAPINASQATLRVEFEDLDVTPVNDPNPSGPPQHLESVNVLTGGLVSLTGGPITDLSSSFFVSGNFDMQVLSLIVNLVPNAATFLVLDFTASIPQDGNKWYNTTEYLFATMTPVPGPVAGAGLPSLIIAAGLLTWTRRRRQLA
jgi:hypothetical protein